MHKIIHAADAHDALVDALTDLLHVHGGPNAAFAAAVADARNLARYLHYPAERDGEDGVTVEVIAAEV